MSIEIGEPKYELVNPSTLSETIETSDAPSSPTVTIPVEPTTIVSVAVDTIQPEPDNTSSLVIHVDNQHSVKVQLVDLITNIILDNDLQKKYELKYKLPINAIYIDYLQKMVKSYPHYFTSFEKGITTIVKDGKISSADIPDIIQLIIELYTILYSLRPKDMIDVCANIVKIVFFIAVKERVVIVENELDVIVEFDIFIDSIVDLLEMHTQLSNTCSNIKCNLHFWPFK